MRQGNKAATLADAMRSPTETINQRIVMMGRAAAMTADWIERSTAAIPALAGVTLEVVSTTEVIASQEGRVLATAVLAEDTESYAVVFHDGTVLAEKATTLPEFITRAALHMQDLRQQQADEEAREEPDPPAPTTHEPEPEPEPESPTDGDAR